MPTTTSKASPIGFFPATSSHISLTSTSSLSVTHSASATTTPSATTQSDSTTIKATRSTDASIIPTICTPTTTTSVIGSPEMFLIISDGIAGCVVGIMGCVFIGLLILYIWERKRNNTTQGI